MPLCEEAMSKERHCVAGPPSTDHRSSLYGLTSYLSSCNNRNCDSTSTCPKQFLISWAQVPAKRSQYTMQSTSESYIIPRFLGFVCRWGVWATCTLTSLTMICFQLPIWFLGLFLLLGSGRITFWATAMFSLMHSMIVSLWEIAMMKSVAHISHKSDWETDETRWRKS